MTPRRITPDELERKAFENPGTEIKPGDTDATLTVGGVTYVAEFDIKTAVAG
jgi:hypothetical protein